MAHDIVDKFCWSEAARLHGHETSMIAVTRPSITENNTGLDERAVNDELQHVPSSNSLQRHHTATDFQRELS